MALLDDFSTELQYIMATLVEAKKEEQMKACAKRNNQTAVKANELSKLYDTEHRVRQVFSDAAEQPAVEDKAEPVLKGRFSGTKDWARLGRRNRQAMFERAMPV